MSSKFTKTPKSILDSRRATENALHGGYIYEATKTVRGEQRTAFFKRLPRGQMKQPGVSVWNIRDNCKA